MATAKSFFTLVLGAGVTEVNRQTRGLLLQTAKPKQGSV